MLCSQIDSALHKKASLLARPIPRPFPGNPLGSRWYSEFCTCVYVRHVQVEYPDGNVPTYSRPYRYIHLLKASPSSCPLAAPCLRTGHSPNLSSRAFTYTLATANKFPPLVNLDFGSRNHCRQSCGSRYRKQPR